MREGGLRRDTFWHDRQSPSLTGKRGSDRTRGDMPAPIKPPGATDWSAAGGEINLFIGTRAWLIKQVPLGQKAAGVGLLYVPGSARLAGRNTPPHKGREDDALFFNIEIYRTQEHMRGCNCLRVFRCQDFESKKRSGMCLLWLIHILL